MHQYQCRFGQWYRSNTMRIISTPYIVRRFVGEAKFTFGPKVQADVIEHAANKHEAVIKLNDWIKCEPKEQARLTKESERKKAAAYKEKVRREAAEHRKREAAIKQAKSILAKAGIINETL